MKIEFLVSYLICARKIVCSIQYNIGSYYKRIGDLSNHEKVNDGLSAIGSGFEEQKTLAIFLCGAAFKFARAIESDARIVAEVELNLIGIICIIDRVRSLELLLF